jgi:hypothetical protein
MTPAEYGATKREICDVLWNGKGLLKDKESFLIELEPWEK